MTSTAFPRAKLPALVAFVLAVAAGYSILMYLPHTAAPGALPAPTTWYLSVQTAVKTAMRTPTGILLFLCGLGLGWVQPRHWFLLALSTLAVLPAATIAELVASQRLPTRWTVIEFVMFFCMALPALGGAAIGRMICYKGLPAADSKVF